MLITCKKCGKTAQGGHYQFHYGKMSNPQFTSQDYLAYRYTTFRATYQIFGEDGADICNRCATPKIGGRKTAAFIVMGVCWAVLAGIGTWAGFLTTRYGWQAALFWIVPGLFFATVSLLGMLEFLGKGLVLANTNTGEKVAIDVRRKDLCTIHSSPLLEFWTSKRYRKLIGNQAI